MQRTQNRNWRLTLLRLGVAAPVVLVSACQVVPQPAPPAPRLVGDRSISVAGVTAAATPAPVGTTYTVKRDTLQQALSLNGRVDAGRSAQLVFHSAGTVGAVNVSPGQAVEAGTVLAELTLEETALQAARTQATLAQLAYESEQAKLAQMKSGANPDAIDQLRVTIERDQAEIQKLQQDQSGVDASNSKADQALVAAQADADHKVALAEQAVQSAKDLLAGAQANVKEVQDDAQVALEQSRVDAQTAVTVANGSVRSAQRQLDQANRALGVAKKNPLTTAASQRLETQQLRVDQDKDSLSDAQATAASASGQSATADHPAHQIASEVAVANGAVKVAQRTLQTDSLELKHIQGELADAKAADADAITIANQNVDDAKAQLATAQQVLQLAQQKADALTKQTTPTPGRAGQQTMANAQTAVKQAEANVRTTEVNLQQAHDAQTAAAAATSDPTVFSQHLLQAAQLQLSSDQAKLKALQAGTSAAEITQEETRVSILRDQANSAAQAAQPVVPLSAPFAGTITNVSLTPGQTIGAGAQPSDASAAGAAIQLVASGPDSILVDAGESDVAQLKVGQSVDVTFPGLPGQHASGTVSDIATSATLKNNQAIYPARIELPSLPSGLKVGMTSQASVVVSEAKDVLVAPSRAIRSVGGQTLMTRLTGDGQMQDTPIQVGRTFGSNVELVGGVKEGDVVAVFDGSLAANAASPSQ
jgi:multidrug efflux pump subunit AcrA (membrane-fusion protein)